MLNKITTMILLLVGLSSVLFIESVLATVRTNEDIEQQYQEKALVILKDTPEREPLTIKGKQELMKFIKNEYMPIDGCSLMDLPKDSDINYEPPAPKKRKPNNPDFAKTTPSTQASEKEKQQVLQFSKSKSQELPIHQGKVYSLSEEEKLWLERLVEAEATGEPYEGKVAVASVIANRVESESFPNDIMSVIKANNGKFHQFSPWDDGRIHTVIPKDSTKKAVQAVFKHGVRNLPNDVVYFAVKDIAFENWIGKTRKHVVTVDNHAFFSQEAK